MRDGVKDLSTISTIPYHTLEKLFDRFMWVICDTIEESSISHEDYAQVDIGIGRIDINIADNEIQYRFVPSKKLDDYVRDTIINGKNPLIKNLEEGIATRVVNAYKDLF